MTGLQETKRARYFSKPGLILSCLLCRIGGLESFVLRKHDRIGLLRSQNQRPVHFIDATIGRIREKQQLPCRLSERKNYLGQQSKSIEGENEWGVPWSSDLPPLGDITQWPLPKQLNNGGKVTMLGSGPGDPDLLTVSAFRLLTEVAGKENALIVVDRLVSQEILDLIPTTAEVKVARKLPGCADLAQEEIYWWCYQGLNQGRHVIRLKIGDPFVFGRGGEEVLKFRDFGVEPTVIPGVSAAFSAPLLGNIPVTHRGYSNQVVMCTGYGRDGTSPDLIRYHKEQTIVFLMAVGRLKELCNKLISMAGYPSDTPVAIVERAGCPNQRTVIGDMSNIATLAELHNVKPPSTIIVGSVVRVLLKNDAQQQVIEGYRKNEGAQGRTEG